MLPEKLVEKVVATVAIDSCYAIEGFGAGSDAGAVPGRNEVLDDGAVVDNVVIEREKLN